MDAYRGSAVKTERCGETVAYEVLAGIRVYSVDQTGRGVYNAKYLVCGHSWQDRGNSRVCPAIGVPPVPPTVADLEDIEKAPDQIDVSIACGGLCCRRFFLPLTPDELACPDTMATKADGAYIADMVIHLKTVDDQSFYTCRHLREDGLCGSYETRPQMCRAFPYGGPCPFPGCPSGVPSTP